MGYRNYIAPISKKEHNKIKNYSLKELFKYKSLEVSENLDSIGVYDIPDKAIYELGKYVDEFDNSLFKSVFTKKETANYFLDEHDFYLVNKDFLEAVIEKYSEKVKNYYRDMLDPFYETSNNFLKVKKKGILRSLNRDYDDELNETYTLDYSEITQKEQTAIFKSIEHIKNMATEWGEGGKFSKDNRPYNLNGKSLVSSWKYEYVVFELVRIYKTFDWENNLMIYYGY